MEAKPHPSPASDVPNSLESLNSLELSEAEQTDKYLIERCRAGDAAAWDEVVSKYQRLVLSVPLSFGFDTYEAEDIAQITFVILMQSLDNLRNIEHIGSWLYTVAQRHTWRALKRSQNTAADVLDDNTAEARVVFGHSNVNDLERWEVADWLNQGLHRLGKRCQDLLLAMYFDPDEPEYAQIAQRIGVAVGSIGPMRARCLKTLQQLLLRNG